MDKSDRTLLDDIKNAEPSDFFQDKSAPRIKGMVARYEHGFHALHLFQGTDISTAIHELGHAIETMMPREMRDALRAHGVTDEETLARSFERYFMTGETEHEPLQKPMRTIATEMSKVYSDAARIPSAKASPEIREQFDRFFMRESERDPIFAQVFGSRWFAQEDDEIPPDFLVDEGDAPPPPTENRPRPGEVIGGTPEERGRIGARQGLRGARTAYGKQKAGYSAERSARFKKAEAIMRDESLDPMERHIRAKHELRGELPKIDFAGFKELDDEALAAMMRAIQDHPNLMTGQRVRATDALLGAIDGRVPTASEIILLEHVFGKVSTRGIRDIARHPLREAIMDLLNVPRSIMASFDLSAPFRQGLVAGARHPRMFAKNFGPMVRAMRSPEYHTAVEESIKNDVDFPLAIDAKLALTDFESPVTREERYFSNAAEKIPVVGIGVRGSARAYVTFLNKMRMDMFKHHIRLARDMGLDVNNQEFLQDLGKVINASTGRGGLGPLEHAAPALNTFFFSPRLMASRINFLNPVWYAKLDPYARKLALRSFVQLGASATAFVGALSLVAGVTVETDPRNPDWGKVKIGNVRFDVGGGFQQPIRLAAQMATGTAISSTTGRRLSLTSGGFGVPTRLDILLRFFQGKEAPIASFITDALRGHDQIGKPFEWDKALYQRMIPLLAQDAYDLGKDQGGGVNGIALAAAGYTVGAFGFGIQTYGPENPATKSMTKLQHDAETAGFPKPSESILNALDHRSNLDSISAQHPKDPNGRLQDAIEYYDKTTGRKDFDNLRDQKLPDEAAETIYHSIRLAMVSPSLAAYERAVDAVLKAKEKTK
jgi:hypothetical protein